MLTPRSSRSALVLRNGFSQTFQTTQPNPNIVGFSTGCETCLGELICVSQSGSRMVRHPKFGCFYFPECNFGNALPTLGNRQCPPAPVLPDSGNSRLASQSSRVSWHWSWS